MPNSFFDTDAELASLSLTFLPDGESGQWQMEPDRPESGTQLPVAASARLARDGEVTFVR